MAYMSYNLRNYGRDEDTVRREAVHAVIRACAPDVLAVQEIYAAGPDPRPRAERLLRELAHATGMECELPSGQLALALGNAGYHVAVLWRPGLTPVSWTPWSGSLWHAMGTLVLIIDGEETAFIVYHAGPFGKHRRADEAEIVIATATRPPAARRATLAAGDWNCVFSNRYLLRVDPMEPDLHPEDQKSRYLVYDHDPFTQVATFARLDTKPPQEWSPEWIYQCTWETVHETQIAGLGNGLRPQRWQADRSVGDILAASALRDPAVTLGAPWQATAGHWKNDPYPPRRFDAIRVTAVVTVALVEYPVVSSDLAKSASDHLPVLVRYVPAGIADLPDNFQG